MSVSYLEIRTVRSLRKDLIWIFKFGIKGVFDVAAGALVVASVTVSDLSCFFVKG